ncbi:hypothetical protein SARC_11981 [Sphaeroforma arctica JP610]|uniref:Uncharacterized protein n=1 Tax=Sphaeroforma arctica JP610 TaxID=667725 RepID=A0A0L0FFD1_9EUKA|nr:hypothetical protein SARC_11981 [Sphaeroforma arctica JP610]KNC75492.1 hypothetical protein SARC_11981 [Sphaeroforma arctica JP610]|eukprot:XP_014149394.1 hypothetical protein SARC_11981 [Sphaeroforma arctica JP610]
MPCQAVAAHGGVDGLPGLLSISSTPDSNLTVTSMTESELDYPSLFPDSSDDDDDCGPPANTSGLGHITSVPTLLGGHSEQS